MKSMLHLVESPSRSDVVVRCDCNEPDGIVTREVRLLRFTPENLSKFWAQAKKHRTIFRFEIGGDFRKFMDRFVKQGPGGDLLPTGIFWVVDDFVGVFYLTDIDIGIDAVAHYSFFDGRHHGREKLVMEMLKYVFETIKFHRLTSEIPLHASPHTHNFVEHTVGFKKEGRKRAASELNGKFYDLNIYGLTKDEAFMDHSELLKLRTTEREEELRRVYFSAKDKLFPSKREGI